MYDQFFGFEEKPFTLLPDPDFLYFSERHNEGISMLEYGLINSSGIVLITGNIGCGKTTMIRHILKNQDVDMVVGNVTNTHRSFGELLKWIMFSLGLDYSGKDKVEMYHSFIEFLDKEHDLGNRVVLVIDEAHNLSRDALEELRMLSNINVDKEHYLQLILVGQPELREILKDPSLEQLANRISVDYYLEPLSALETFEYIRHRLDISGGDSDIFDLEAIKAVYESTSGNPRLINTVCDTALVYAFAEQSKKVTLNTIKEVIEDKSRWNVIGLNSSKERRSGFRHVQLG
ncbi:MAG: ExeA family protein [Thiotrichales bacterium]